MNRLEHFEILSDTQQSETRLRAAPIFLGEEKAIANDQEQSECRKQLCPYIPGFGGHRRREDCDCTSRSRESDGADEFVKNETPRTALRRLEKAHALAAFAGEHQEPDVDFGDLPRTSYWLLRERMAMPSMWHAHQQIVDALDVFIDVPNGDELRERTTERHDKNARNDAERALRAEYRAMNAYRTERVELYGLARGALLAWYWSGSDKDAIRFRTIADKLDRLVQRAANHGFVPRWSAPATVEHSSKTPSHEQREKFMLAVAMIDQDRQLRGQKPLHEDAVLELMGRVHALPLSAWPSEANSAAECTRSRALRQDGAKKK